MKTSKFAFRLFSLAMTLVLMFGMSGLSALAADESDYVAEFKITTDKVSLEKDEETTVRVSLKTNYYICAASLVVIYDGEAMTLQNTSETNVAGFLTFSGSLAGSYRTNGNWTNTETLFEKRNSNTAYWSQESVMSRYKAVYATWAADTSISSELAVLSEEEEILSFVIRANEAVDDLSELIFISLDFQKTSSAQQGTLFVGRSTTKEYAIANMVNVGQTIIYNGIDPTKKEPEVSASISPADGTGTVIDRENGLIYGLEEGLYSLDSSVEVVGYTLRYTYINNSFGTGTKVECLLNGETKETYYVVVFGDISGDAVIDTYDSAIAAAAANGDINLYGTRLLAADVFVDGVTDTYDCSIIASAVNGDRVISQTNS